MTLSVVIITFNEEANIRRTLESVQPILRDGGEIIIVDNGSTDRTLEIAREFGAQVLVEEWKGYAAQKNSAIGKATCDWVLSLDADESLEPELAEEIKRLNEQGAISGYRIPRKNFFLNRWIKHGGFYPDRKLRLFRRGTGRFIERSVHEVMQVDGEISTLKNALLHNAYPTLTGYIATMNRYSSLGAQLRTSQGNSGLYFLDIAIRPLATFLYNYIIRLGFLDGTEGLLLHLYHSTYVSWKYAKAWELERSQTANHSTGKTI